MLIRLLAIGKTFDKRLVSLIDDYTGRLKHYTRFEYLELAGKKSMPPERQAEAEGQQLLAQLQPTDYLVVLDEGGKQLSSEQFAAQMEQWMNAGTRTIVFAIGGAYGFSAEVQQRAHYRLSLSAMTFTHQMVRLIFAEQLYRAFTIIRNEPYHHS